MPNVFGHMTVTIKALFLQHAVAFSLLGHHGERRGLTLAYSKPKPEVGSIYSGIDLLLLISLYEFKLRSTKFIRFRWSPKYIFTRLEPSLSEERLNDIGRYISSVGRKAKSNFGP